MRPRATTTKRNQEGKQESFLNVQKLGGNIKKECKDHIYRRHWQAEEDAFLEQAVHEQGTKRWSAVADLVPGKSARQCRERWKHFLDPTISKAEFTENEDHVIFKNAQRGYGWSKIASLLTGRTDQCVKNRWHKLVERHKRSHELLDSRTRKSADFPIEKGISSSASSAEKVELANSKEVQRFWDNSGIGDSIPHDAAEIGKLDGLEEFDTATDGCLEGNTHPNQQEACVPMPLSTPLSILDVRSFDFGVPFKKHSLAKINEEINAVLLKKQVGSEAIDAPQTTTHTTHIQKPEIANPLFGCTVLKSNERTRGARMSTRIYSTLRPFDHIFSYKPNQPLKLINRRLAPKQTAQAKKPPKAQAEHTTPKTKDPRAIDLHCYETLQCTKVHRRQTGAIKTPSIKLLM